jgi:hypothetical protein
MADSPILMLQDIQSRLDAVQGIQQAEIERVREQERLRGVKYIRREGYPGVNQISIPDFPEPGYAWNLKLISVQLSATSAFDVYIGDQTTVTGLVNRRQIFNALTNTQQVMTWTSDQVIIFNGDRINLDAVAAAVTITEYFLCAIQVPEEMLGKVLF